MEESGDIKEIQIEKPDLEIIYRILNQHDEIIKINADLAKLISKPILWYKKHNLLDTP